MSVYAHSNELLLKKTKLMEVSYRDNMKKIYLKNYADTIVFDDSRLIAIRFGGYPEQVKAMADAIYGGGLIVIETQEKKPVLKSMVKQYRRDITHNGIYAEATLLLNDDMQTDDNNNDIFRAAYIYSENEDDLFDGINNKIAVPLIPEFKTYLIDELIKNRYIEKMNILSSTESFHVWKLLLSANDKNIVDIVENGLKSGIISIPGTDVCNNDSFKEINSLSEYLNKFSVPIAEKIKSTFRPLYDPKTDEISKEVMQINAHVQKKAGYSLYNAQLGVAEAMKRVLKKMKIAYCIGECGTGKSKMGATALGAYHLDKNYTKTFNIVLCPSHLSKKWIREIEETIPNTFAVLVKSIHEFDKVYDVFAKNDKHCFVIITKEKARDGYMIRPAVRWNERQAAFLCPHCNKPIMMEVFSESRKVKVVADAFYFQKRNKKNYKCDCGEVLWAPLLQNNNQFELFPNKKQSEWVKISDWGYVHRKFAGKPLRNILRKCLNDFIRKKIHTNNDEDESIDKSNETTNEQFTVSANIVSECESDEIMRNNLYQFMKAVESGKTKLPKTYYDIEKIVNNPTGNFRYASAYRRFMLSKYIKNKYKGKIDGLIVDELHQYNNDSGQGDAMYDLQQSAKKVADLTGTLINGYARGLFFLLYRTSSSLMKLDDFNYDQVTDFAKNYGVIESTFTTDADEYNAKRRSVKSDVREKQLPGVSPLIYTRYLINNCVFLSLYDMGKDLPDYEEIPVVFQLEEDVQQEYRRIEDEFVKVLKYDKPIAMKVMSKFTALLTAFPDQPYNNKEIVHPINFNPIIIPKNLGDITRLNAKDKWLLNKVKEKIGNGERVIIYTSWIRLDTQEKLLKLLKAEGIATDILTTRIKPDKREQWIEKKVKEGLRVLIVNPELCETGLDLNDFTTLIYYNISYKLFTLRQSSRRSWRINQKAPRIEVYFLYFKDVLQHRAIRLMASKLAVAGIVEGSYSDEGLAAMSQCQDLTTLLAQELAMGIKNDIEDLGEIFKRTANIKPINPIPEDEDKNANQTTMPLLSGHDELSTIHSEIENALESVNTPQKISSIKANPVTKSSTKPMPAKLQTNLNKTNYQENETEQNTIVKKKQKKQMVFTNHVQLTLFDSTDSISA